MSESNGLFTNQELIEYILQGDPAEVCASNERCLIEQYVDTRFPGERPSQCGYVSLSVFRDEKWEHYTNTAFQERCVEVCVDIQYRKDDVLFRDMQERLPGLRAEYGV